MATPRLDQESTIDGRRTQLWVLKASECAELRLQRISRLGIHAAHAPYQRVRLRPSGSFILACLEGEGRVLLEGRWQRVLAGEVCLAPPRVLNALHAIPGQKWVLAWVRYEEPAFVKPLVGAESPLRLRNGCEQLGQAITGLRSEWERGEQRSAALCHHYLSLIQGLAKRLTSPWQASSRLAEFWETVASSLAQDWTLHSLAAECHMSHEHLRRLCQSELGRSPMDQLAYMRIQRAKELLEQTDEKVEQVARDVGFRSGTAFSRSFSRYVGVPPAQYRAFR
jgi:AraC-like DNA-binding protein